jgi:hypothetical protein
MNINFWWRWADRLRGLAVRVPGCRSRSPRLDYRCYQILWIFKDQLDQSSFRPNNTARLTRLLNPNKNCPLWAGTRLANELPLNYWTASHCSVELLLTILLNCFSLFCWTASHCSVELLLTILLNCFLLFWFCSAGSGLWLRVSSRGS